MASPGGVFFVVRELVVDSRSVWQISIERLAVLQTAPEELRPRRNTRQRVALLRKQPPELRVMPAQVMSGAIAMRANAGAQFPDLRDERFTVEVGKVFVHDYVLLPIPYRPIFSLPGKFQALD
jgi:hypothetical protein